jgi:hypothetical protein
MTQAERRSFVGVDLVGGSDKVISREQAHIEGCFVGSNILHGGGCISLLARPNQKTQHRKNADYGYHTDRPNCSHPPANTFQDMHDVHPVALVLVAGDLVHG